MIYGDVCSGISAPTVAWNPLGWRAAFYAEIAKFPSDVLAHHYAQTPNRGDFTKIQSGDHEPIDILVGGTPCQDFSVAGLRAGMDGKRGQLTAEYALLAGRLRPTWLVWENVPGLLSIDGGRAFHAFLRILAELGYGFAYRILDAQYFGVPQRRRRVFVVGHLGDWRRAAAVLFERESLSGHPAPRREAGQGLTYDVAPCLAASGRGFERSGDTRGQDRLVAGTLQANVKAAGSGTQQDAENGFLITHALRGEGFDASEDGTGRGTPLVPVTAGTLKANNGGGGFGSDPSETFVPIAFNLRGRDGGAMPEPDDLASIRAASGGSSRSHIAHSAVRRLTPRECERLQGFPDDYTKISEKAADGPRYKALGNSMAVPVMRWIAQRIQAVQ